MLSIITAALRSNLFQLPEDDDIRYILQKLGSSNADHLNPNNGRLLAPIMIPRQPDAPGIAKVRQFIVEHFTKLKWHIELNSFVEDTPVGPKNFTNIIVTKDILAPRVLVLSAHYDSKVMTEDGKEFIGATDSAGPCAVLLELAEALNGVVTSDESKGGNAGTSLQVIFFDGEEAFVQWKGNDNTYGSRYLARNMSDASPRYDESRLEDSSIHGSPRNRIEQIDLMILLDLLGSTNPWPTIPNFFRETSNLFDYMASIESKLLELNLLSSARKDSPKPYFYGKSVGGIGDDHLPFMERNVPILHLIPHPFPDVWHKISDDATAINEHVLYDYAKILRVFILQYLDLGIMRD